MLLWHVIFFINLVYCNCYKILGIVNIPTPSHHRLSLKLLNELAKKGHEVTFISPYAPKLSNNLTEIEVADIRNTTSDNKSNFFEQNCETAFEIAKFQNNVLFLFTERLLKSEKIQTFLNSNETFDVIILHYIFNDALMALGHHFKAAIILFVPMPLYASASFLLSHPSPSSYVPNILTKYSGPMNFWQRLRNSFLDTAMILYYNWFMLPKHKELVKKYIPGNIHLDDVYSNVSLTLINSHVSINEAIPIVPNAVEIGGFHLDGVKPLPKNLQNFLDESTNGVIYFSLGSYIQSADLPQKKKEILISTFSKLKQNVLWKFEDTNFTTMPKNIKIMKWIPQSDVLAHPNVKLFISHGGLLSTIESVFQGVPIVGIPITSDQKMNIALAESYEYAIEVSYDELNEETLTKSINQVLTDPKYLQNVKRRSRILKDRPIKPLDNAIYWVEYVIRHKGASHLKYPGMNLNWFQRNLLDVFVFIILVTLLPISSIIFVFLNSKKTLKLKKS